MEQRLCSGGRFPVAKQNKKVPNHHADPWRRARSHHDTVSATASGRICHPPAGSASGTEDTDTHRNADRAFRTKSPSLGSRPLKHRHPRNLERRRARHWIFCEPPTSATLAGMFHFPRHSVTHCVASCRDDRSLVRTVVGRVVLNPLASCRLTETGHSLSHRVARKPRRE